MIFYKSKPFFLSPQKNRYDIFWNQKILFYLINTDLNFSLQKTIFFFMFSKADLIFLNQIQFFSLITTNLNFNKEEYAFISKLVWFGLFYFILLLLFFYVCNISSMTCIKVYIGHKSLEDQTLSGRNGCLTPSYSVT